jgi:lipopolysaccharide export system permease protein
MDRLMPTTLGLYLARLYTVCLLVMTGILLSIVYLFETVELLRRAANRGDIPLSLIFQMSFLKLPEAGQIILPFAVLFSALYTFWLLARRHELVVLRAAGLSVWRFLSPVIAVAFAAGIVHMTIINPIGALMIARYEGLQASVLNVQEKIVSISEQGLWLRQNTDQGHVIIHADSVAMPQWILNTVMVLYFNQSNDFIRRIDSENAILKDGLWVFQNVAVNEGRSPPVRKAQETLPSLLTVKEIEESFSTPEETPFWSLPHYIDTMQSTGFDSRALKIHFQSLLAQPLLFAAMVILAATVSLKPARLQRTPLMILWGVLFGFLVFFVGSFLKALGASDQIPVLLAAWTPPLMALALGVSVIMTTEDG